MTPNWFPGKLIHEEPPAAKCVPVQVRRSSPKSLFHVLQPQAILGNPSTVSFIALRLQNSFPRETQLVPSLASFLIQYKQNASLFQRTLEKQGLSHFNCNFLFSYLLLLCVCAFCYILSSLGASEDRISQIYILNIRNIWVQGFASLPLCPHV